jgi:hypothetical protein
LALCEKIISFNKNLHFNGILPDSIQIMNPFKENPQIIPITEKFYRDYYNDDKSRTIILGINPGRKGAGITGIPFTDPKRLKSYFNISIDSNVNEPSAEFIYNVIENFGGIKKFYSRFYINSVCPLGFTRLNKKGNKVNCNYYDDPDLTDSVKDFILNSIKSYLKFGINVDTCYCLGSGENYHFLNDLNMRENLFGEIIALPHPSYIMRKRSKKEFYINEYLKILNNK